MANSFVWSVAGLGAVILVIGSLHVSTIQAVCNPKFSGFAKDHTACSTVDASIKGKKGITTSDKDFILQIHNEYRAKQPATNMLKMNWDEEIAMLAQKHAERCVWGHDKNHQRFIPGRLGTGQNIAIGYPDWKTALYKWYIEIDNFEYGKGPKDDKEPIGHYTAMVWAQSNKIGCGWAICHYQGNDLPYYVCNYGPMGNVRGNAGTMKEPYKKGSMGSECMKRTSSGLCDCGLNECDNTGVMEVSTCKCSCPKKPWFLSGSHCKIDCSKVGLKQEPQEYCTDFEDCYVYLNFPAECPSLCRQCASGTDNWSKTTTTAAPTTTEQRTTTAQTGTVAPLKTVVNTLIEHPSTCRLTTIGSEYMGTKSKTDQNIDCQHWDVKTPHYHSVTAGQIPDARLQDAANYCRNPSGGQGERKPWCYTSDPNKRWQFCDIPMCKANCYNDAVNGVDFAGTLSTASNGKTCIPWSKQSRHKATKMPEETLAKAKNYCRNPAGENHRVWCYTSESLSWDYCDVPKCT